LQGWTFPVIPGVNRPHEANTAYHLNFGSNASQGILTIQPPKIGQSLPALVPQVDADGNDRAGIHLPEIAVPLATYTGWNLRDPSIGAPDQRVSFEGSYLPFPKTVAERQRTGDPRKSVAERYSDRQDYVRRYTKAIDDLVKERWILPEDRDALRERGEMEWVETTR
jgi:hypothetical protein